MDCGSLLPLCGGRSLLRAARSRIARLFAPRRGQQAAHHHSGSRLPQSAGFATRQNLFLPRRGAKCYGVAVSVRGVSARRF